MNIITLTIVTAEIWSAIIISYFLGERDGRKKGNK